MTREQRIGQRIRERRKYLGWSQEQLARKLSVGNGAVSHYENGKRHVPLEILDQIATALRTTTGELLGERQDAQPERRREPLYKVVAASTEVVVLTEEEQRLLDTFMRGLMAERDEASQDAAE